VLRFFEGQTRARDTLQRRFWMTRGGAGWAGRADPSGYVRWGIDGQIRRDDFSNFSRPDTLGHTVTGTVGGYVQWRKARFRKDRGILGFDRDEDFDLGTSVHASLTMTPKGFGYREDGLVPGVSVRTGLGWSGGFVTIAASALGRITDAGRVDSGSVHIGATLIQKPTKRQMLVVHGSHGWQKSPMPGGEFDLGLGIGPRGFVQHAFTGDRAFFLTTEYRYTVTEDLLRSAGLGFAAFADYGGAWYAGSARRTGYAVGVGIRFGLTLSTDLEPARADLAWVNGDGLTRGAWRLAFGKGFVFNLSNRLDR